MISGEDSQTAADNSQLWIDEWLLRKVIRESFEQLPVSQAAAEYGIRLVRLLVGQCNWRHIKSSKAGKPRTVMAAWLEDPAVKDFLRINTHNEIDWFNQEAMEIWLDWMTILGVINVINDDSISDEDKPKQMVQIHDWILRMEKAVGLAEYQVGKLTDQLKGK